MSVLVKKTGAEQPQTRETVPATSNSRQGRLALPSKMLMTPRHSKPCLDPSAWNVPESFRPGKY